MCMCVCVCVCVCVWFSLRQVKIEQRKLNDNSNSLVDMAKVRQSFVTVAIATCIKH